MKLTKFQEAMMETSKLIPDRKTLPGARQEFIMFYAPQLLQLRELEQKFVDTYGGMADRAELIALACRFFLEQTKEPEKDKK